jgi:hypothetical protein
MHVWTQSLELNEIEHVLTEWVDMQKDKGQQVMLTLQARGTLMGAAGCVKQCTQ